MDISFARGDLYVFPFAVYIDGELYTQNMDSIFFTVKKHYFDDKPLFQKSYIAGTIAQNGDGTYLIRIEPEDTENLPFGTYDYDIQVEKFDGSVVQIKRTFTGKMELTSETTHADDETYGDVDPGTVVPGTNLPRYYVVATESDTQTIIDSYGV